MNCMRDGFTLPELVLGIAITAVIGLSVAGVAMVLSTGYAQGDEYADASQTAQMISLQLSRQIREAPLVVASDSGRLILWTSDANSSGSINLNELIVISYDTSKKQLKQYKNVFPTSWSSWLTSLLNTQLSLSTLSSASSVETYIRNQTYCETTVLASDVSSFKFTVNTSAPLATLVTMSYTTGTGDSAQKFSTAVNLRAERTSDVVKVGTLYYLSGE